MFVVSISGLGPNTNYTAVIYGKNQHGESSASYKVILRTQGMICFIALAIISANIYTMFKYLGYL